MSRAFWLGLVGRASWMRRILILQTLLLIHRLWMFRADLFENDGADGIRDEEEAVAGLMHS